MIGRTGSFLGLFSGDSEVALRRRTELTTLRLPYAVHHVNREGLGPETLFAQGLRPRGWSVDAKPTGCDSVGAPAAAAPACSASTSKRGSNHRCTSPAKNAETGAQRRSAAAPMISSGRCETSSWPAP